MYIPVVERIVNWDRDNAVPEEPEVVTPATSVHAPGTPQNPIPVRIVLPHTPTQNQTTLIETHVRPSRNGHKSEMVRKLNNTERDLFRTAFITKNGEFEEDDCVVLKRRVSAEVAIFQVTGFISYLHRDVAQGRTVLPDLQRYKDWMSSKYPNLLQQYFSPRFALVREANEQAREAGRPMNAVPIREVPIRQQFSTEPTFVIHKRKGVYKGE